MKLDIDFSALEKLVKEMGASSIPWTSGVDVINTVYGWEIILETTGIDVDIKDIEKTDDGLLKYNGKQILLYIKVVNQLSQYGLPKFHFYQCATLNNMEKQKRFERYVVTQRKTGYFLMDKKHGIDYYEKDVEEKLDVCKNCLNWYNRVYRKNHSVSTFDIPEFFQHFQNTPINKKPTNTDLFSSPQNYQSRPSLKSINNASDLNKLFGDYSSTETKNYFQETDDENLDEKQEDYVEILPVNTKTTALELDIDENTQNFEDMF
jgi:hypothetical protein